MTKYRIDYDHLKEWYKLYKDGVYQEVFYTEWGARRAIKRDKKLMKKLNGATIETVYREEV